MSYIRIIPRDLFNEANLLKCLGALYIALDGKLGNGGFGVEGVDYFDIRQNPNDGSIFVENLPFSVNGRSFHLSRPLNSRTAWPLYLSSLDDCNFEPIRVFADDGSVSAEMFNLLASS